MDLHLNVDAWGSPDKTKRKKITYTEGQMLHDPSYMIHLKKSNCSSAEEKAAMVVGRGVELEGGGDAEALIRAYTVLVIQDQ